MCMYSAAWQVDESFIRVPVTTKSHDEVFVISTMGASNYYHRLVEQLPRIAPYIDFLRRNPTIRIHIRQLESAKDNTSRSMTAALLVAMGITDAGGRIVTGVVRATVAYVPRFAECLWSRPVELQVMSHLLRRHTTTKLFSGGSQGSGSSAKGYLVSIMSNFLRCEMYCPWWAIDDGEIATIICHTRVFVLLFTYSS